MRETSMQVSDKTSSAKEGPISFVQSGDFSLFLMPRGRAEGAFSIGKHSIDVNFSTGKMQCSTGAIKPIETTLQSETIAFLRKETEILVDLQKPVPGCLLEVGDATIEKWFEAAEIDPNSERGYWNYTHDPVGAEIGRAGIRFLNTIGAINSNPDRLTIEALALGIGARAIAYLSSPDSNPDDEMNTWSRRGNQLRLKRAMDYVQSNLSNPSLSVAEMARAADLSSCHFSTVFKAETGQSAYAYILTKRTQFARDLIVGSREPFAVIAHKAGFSNHAHMTSTIKNFYGLTPGQLRKG